MSSSSISSSTSSLLLMVAFCCSILLAAQCSALLIGRQSREFPSRFFIPDSALASQLLAAPAQQFAPDPLLHQTVAAYRGRLYKRYFDSLAGQSLGKRSESPMMTDEKRR